jgi:hypothetical protein
VRPPSFIQSATHPPDHEQSAPVAPRLYALLYAFTTSVTLSRSVALHAFTQQPTAAFTKPSRGPRVALAQQVAAARERAAQVLAADLVRLRARARARVRARARARARARVRVRVRARARARVRVRVRPRARARVRVRARARARARVRG